MEPDKRNSQSPALPNESPKIILKVVSPAIPNTTAAVSQPTAPTVHIQQQPVAQPKEISPTAYRTLNQKDALLYLDRVKYKFADQPEIYNRFLDIMKDFKSKSTDTPGVIERVSNLFRDHPVLITGFNTFLPPGYHIEITNNPLHPVHVTTPNDPTGYTPIVNVVTKQIPTYQQAINPGYPYSLQRSSKVISTVGESVSSSTAPTPPSLQTSLPHHPSSTPIADTVTTEASPSDAPPKHNMEFNHAINYVNKIKSRFAPEPDTYKQFLEILQTYKQSKPIQEVYAQVQELFKGAPDLLDEFKQFLPDTGVKPRTFPSTESLSPTNLKKPVNRPSLSSSNVSTILPTQSAAIPQVAPSFGNPMIQAKKKPKLNKQQDKPGAMEELEFFDKVKKHIGNKATYNEFLKVLNLFSQEIIDTKVLIEKTAPFLDRSPDLLDWFKKFVKYDGDSYATWKVPRQKPDFDPNLCKRSGNSYRLLPKNYPRGQCSGRDELCFEVLNDDWISHPMFTSENGHFASSRKNIYEEALHKCEEERYDFDLNIEANLHAIKLLEPIAKQIINMNSDEKSRFKLPEGVVPGASKSIYQRAIKKIYDRDRGAEIIDALHNTPSVAVPVVLKRLKQKDEEWKRSQRDWNKVWREIDSKNFTKSLDYQGITFKTTDKKSITSKALINEIENIYMEQRSKSTENSNFRYQMDFAFKDPALFRDCRKIITRSIDTSVAAERIANGTRKSDKAKVNEFLKFFIGRFFWIEEEETSISEDETDEEEEDMDDDAKSNADDMDTDENEKKKTVSSLRRKIAEKTMQEMSANGRANVDINTTVGSAGNVGFSDTLKAFPAITPKRSSYAFYSNQSYYVFIRLYQMLYSRLYKLKELSNELAANPPPIEKLNPIAVEMGLQKSDETRFNSEDRYSTLVQNLLELIDGRIETNEFEENARYMFLTSAYMAFTLDKIASSITKQVVSILNDGCCSELLSLYCKERNKETASARQEAIYRLASESYVEDDNLFRLEWFVAEKTLTMQLIAKEDKLTESISSEEKWSVYVDHFVQLSATEGMFARNQEPFLQRNLPKSIPDEPPTNIETKSGLELKICVNTYKIFFVDNTEDFFYRRRSKSINGLSHSDKLAADALIRSKKLDAFLNSAKGWKRTDNEETITERQRRFDEDYKKERFSI